MSGLEDINAGTDQYCMVCYEVVPLGEVATHREEEHGGSSMVDIVPIHPSGDDFIAKDRNMGHFSPHVWIEADDHEKCGECGAVKIKPEDVSKEAAA